MVEVYCVTADVHAKLSRLIAVADVQSVNPRLVRALTAQSHLLLRICAELGFSPSSRGRVSISAQPATPSAEDEYFGD